MEIAISGRHFDISQKMKDYVESKLSEVFAEKTIKIISSKVVLDVQRTRCKAEVIVNAKHIDFEAVVETFEMYDSIDKAIDKVSVQLRKYLDKVQSHHGDEKLAAIEAKATAAAASADDEEV